MPRPCANFRSSAATTCACPRSWANPAPDRRFKPHSAGGNSCRLKKPGRPRLCWPLDPCGPSGIKRLDPKVLRAPAVSDRTWPSGPREFPLRPPAYPPPPSPPSPKPRSDRKGAVAMYDHSGSHRAVNPGRFAYWVRRRHARGRAGDIQEKLPPKPAASPLRRGAPPTSHAPGPRWPIEKGDRSKAAPSPAPQDLGCALDECPERPRFASLSRNGFPVPEGP